MFCLTELNLSKKFFWGIACNAIVFLCLSASLSGCAGTNFQIVGDDEYLISKNSNACAAGSPSSVMNYLRQEAIKFCAGRKEIPVEVESSTTMGIPVVRCTSAELRFKCAASNTKE